MSATVNRMEEYANQYWGASQLWRRGISSHTPVETVGDIIELLRHLQLVNPQTALAWRCMYLLDDVIDDRRNHHLEEAATIVALPRRPKILVATTTLEAAHG